LKDRYIPRVTDPRQATEHTQVVSIVLVVNSHEHSYLCKQLLTSFDSGTDTGFAGRRPSWDRHTNIRPPNAGTPRCYQEGMLTREYFKM